MEKISASKPRYGLVYNLKPNSYWFTTYVDQERIDEASQHVQLLCRTLERYFVQKQFSWLQKSIFIYLLVCELHAILQRSYCDKPAVIPFLTNIARLCTE